ncbi:hypothetical protein F947_00467 [Acinetobacter towneri DSM 14962 = CIP 107472]|nr:hypothetical protein F947_00467 [Acinetobacter towneri DSM 14962 = CIP 107472]
MTALKDVVYSYFLPHISEKVGCMSKSIMLN